MPRLEVLICEEGGHEWTRLSVRGRKPRFCPKHTFSPQRLSIPSVESKSPRPTIETLICTVGNHEWTRPPTRGRKPTVCPAHAQPKPQPPKPVHEDEVVRYGSVNEMHAAPLRLTGATADQFAAAKQRRVRRPATPVQLEPVRRPRLSALTNLDFDNDVVTRVLREETGSELHRKMMYVIGEFQHPRADREAGDWRLLHYTFGRLMEEASRNLRVQQPVPVD